MRRCTKRIHTYTKVNSKSLSQSSLRYGAKSFFFSKWYKRVGWHHDDQTQFYFILFVNFDFHRVSINLTFFFFSCFVSYSCYHSIQLNRCKVCAHISTPIPDLLTASIEFDVRPKTSSSCQINPLKIFCHIECILLIPF